MFIICLFFLTEPEPVYAYKRYAYKKQHAMKYNGGWNFKKII